MVAISEAKLDKIYQDILKNEDAIVSGNEVLGRAGREYQRMLKKQNQERKVLREQKYSELMQAAVSIFDWLAHFVENPKGRRILSILEDIDIFCACYHNRKPTEWDTYSAHLTYDRKGILHYRETCDYMTSWQIVVANPEQMVRQLHPKYILAALDEIATGRVWELISYQI